MSKPFREFLKENIVLLDGAMGTMLQSLGLEPGELPERVSLTSPELVIGVHQAYFDAGSNVVATNTFGANALKFSEQELEAVIAASVENARIARERSTSNAEKYISLDIGPTGKLIEPIGDLSFERAVEIFSKTVLLGVKYGVDLVTIETMNDSHEMKAALLAVKENSDLPVIVMNAYGEDGRLMSGATPEICAAIAAAMGADAVGANCSFGPERLAHVAKELLSVSPVPVAIKPNAGMPRIENGATVYDLSCADFAASVLSLVEDGVSLVGGCCGTTPEYIRALASALAGVEPLRREPARRTVITSGSKCLTFGEKTVLIGERLNPTGKPRFKAAIKEGDIGYLLNEALSEEEEGAHALDVNVGLPGICESELLPKVVKELQAVSPLPLVIDSSDGRAVELAVRAYNGKPLINSVNGKADSMSTVFPIAKKYGAAVIALTLDERGIPKTKEERVEIAKKILAEAEKYGFDKSDIIFDTLTMAVSADESAPEATLGALSYIERELACRTVLGVSNVSFGLPNREALNAAFFTHAMRAGLSAAIMNPYSEKMKEAYATFNALFGKDQAFSEYVARELSSIDAAKPTEQKRSVSDLRSAIVKGIKEEARALAASLLENEAPLSVINDYIVPALDEVGRGFEEKRIYLPGLLMSAESASAAFEEIKKRSSAGSGERGLVILATVKGDIHDIGKNIVKLLLENYGFCTLDLGKDVENGEIIAAALDNSADIVLLSALMTTTAPRMAEIIAGLREKGSLAKVIVGGAVVDEAYAAEIGADFYAPDAMAAVRYAETVIKA